MGPSAKHFKALSRKNPPGLSKLHSTCLDEIFGIKETWTKSLQIGKSGKKYTCWRDGFHFIICFTTELFKCANFKPNESL